MTNIDLRLGTRNVSGNKAVQAYVARDAAVRELIHAWTNRFPYNADQPTLDERERILELALDHVCLFHASMPLSE